MAGRLSEIEKVGNEIDEILNTRPMSRLRDSDMRRFSSLHRRYVALVGAAFPPRRVRRILRRYAEITRGGV